MNDRPWMTALEMQFAALRGCLALIQGDGTPLEPDKKLICLSAAMKLRAADAYAWSRDAAMASWLAAKTIPADSCLEMAVLPSSAGWWWFEDGLDEKELVAVLWGSTGAGLEMFCFVLNEEAPFPTLGFSFTWAWGWSIGQLLDSARARIVAANAPDEAPAVPILSDLSRFLLAACAWLQQRVVTVSSGHVERHRRKQLAREHNAPLPSDVKVIQLRRMESQSRQSAGADAVDWSCRWIVNGHWRNQPYKDERKLIYIMPFVKGPGDKPLKVPTHTVYQVSR